MLNTFVVYVENKPGVLNRVASLFRRRGFNIESLTVGHTENSGISRMTIVTDTDAAGAFRVETNLYKLINVISVENISAAPSVCRELAMIKVTASSAENRTQLMQLASVFRARVVDVATASLVIEITGTEDKIDGLLEVLRHYGILEVVRTGRVAMSRGSNGNGVSVTAVDAARAASGNGTHAGANGTHATLDPDDGMIAFSV